MHPTVIIRAYRQALEDISEILTDKVAHKVDLDDEKEIVKVIQSCIGTKFVSRWADLSCKIALDAVRTVLVQNKDNPSLTEIDIKRYAKVEKLPGGKIEDSKVIRGVMFNKDVTHPKMPRRLERPRILLLDCNLEYKKGESQTNIEMLNEQDFTKILEQEEAYIKKICEEILAFKPDLVSFVMLRDKCYQKVDKKFQQTSSRTLTGLSSFFFNKFYLYLIDKFLLVYEK